MRRFVAELNAIPPFLLSLDFLLTISHGVNFAFVNSFETAHSNSSQEPFQKTVNELLESTKRAFSIADSNTIDMKKQVQSIVDNVLILKNIVTNGTLGDYHDKLPNILNLLKSNCDRTVKQANETEKHFWQLIKFFNHFHVFC